eukprot:1210886-Alexandrium_andersonii.AAC.1
MACVHHLWVWACNRLCSMAEPSVTTAELRMQPERPSIATMEDVREVEIVPERPRRSPFPIEEIRKTLG